MAEVTSNELLPFGANVLQRNDDQSSPFIDLSSIFENGLNFDGNHFTGIYVNTNGNVTFEGPVSQFTPDVIGDGSQTIIAPFWGDVDTRLPDEGGNGNIYWDFNTERDSFVVTWDDVGYYNRHVDKRNTFQLELADVGDGNFEIIFRYVDFNWTTGDASGGSNGFGGQVARAGFSSGNGFYFELPGSGNGTSVLNWEMTPGNTGVAGVWHFSTTGGFLDGVGTPGDDYYVGDESTNYFFSGAGNDTMYGNGGTDSFYGGSGGDFMSGGAGDDWLEGNEGNDRFSDETGDDNIHGGDGFDTVTFHGRGRMVVDLMAGTAEGDAIGSNVLSGIEAVVTSRGHDVLIGDDSDNRLTGGMGRDVYTGNGGADVFVFKDRSESKASKRDVITDFERGVDKIDLSKIDGNTSILHGVGKQDLKWCGNKDFSGKAGELHWVKKNGMVFVEADVDGDARADFRIQIDDVARLAKDDFIL